MRVVSKLTCLWLIMTIALPAWAETLWMGIHLQGQRIGYVRMKTEVDKLEGRELTRNDSLTVIDAAMLGAGLRVRIESRSWHDAKGDPIRIDFLQSSAGRSQKVTARFEGRKIRAQIDNNGQLSEKNLTIPEGVSVVADPMSEVALGQTQPTAGRTVHIFDPSTVSLVKNTISVLGSREVESRGRKVTATAIKIDDPRGATTVYLGGKGEVVRIEAVMGLVMLPEEQAVAEAVEPSPAAPIDLATSTSIKLASRVERPWQTSRVRLRLRGPDLRAPLSDALQSVRKEGDAWVVQVKTLPLDLNAATTIPQAQRGQKPWTEPSMHMPSRDPEMRRVAREVVGSERRVAPAALRLHEYVYRRMQVNAGIGVLRDAREILKTREGVCRDHAILLGTLLRAADIPARLVGGMVSDGESFYYHAWVEFWTGSRWQPLDSTRPESRVSALRLKMAEGNVEEAFIIPILTGASIDILTVNHEGD